MSFVPASWDQPMLTGEYNSQGVTRVLDAIRRSIARIEFYQASSSEMFGKVREIPQTELTPFYPRSPYGVSKVFGALHHRQLSRELRSVCGLGDSLQSRVAPTRAGVRHPQGDRWRGPHQARSGRFAALGNLDAQRDWGFAGDYVRAMWLMLQQDRGRGLCDCDRGKPFRSRARRDRLRSRRSRLAKHVETDPKFLRPAEVDLLIGESSKAKEESRLGARG